MTETKDCKVEGCEQPAPARGRFAGFCIAHRPEPEQEGNAPPGETKAIAPVVRKLVPAARRLDRANAKHRVSKTERVEAFNEFKRILGQIKKVAEEVLAA